MIPVINKFKPLYSYAKTLRRPIVIPECNNKVRMQKSYNGELLQKIDFDKSIPIIDALKNMISDKQTINELWRLKDYSPIIDIKRLITEIGTSSRLKKYNTNSLIGLGYSSYVFDIGDDKVVKLTLGDHFRSRKPEFFDLPIQESGKISENGRHYYYIEEKVSQDNITENDIRMMEAQLKCLDYILVDCHSARQFGKTKDGHIRLIDPECAEIMPNLWCKNLKETFLDWIYKHLAK